MYREAQRNNRTALARRIEGDFLKTVNYETEEVTPRFVLADSVDDSTLRQIIEGAPPSEVAQPEDDGEGNSERMLDAYDFLSRRLRSDLSPIRSSDSDCGRSFYPSACSSRCSYTLTRRRRTEC